MMRRVKKREECGNKARRENSFIIVKISGIINEIIQD